MSYYEEDEQALKNELIRLDEEYDLGQDAAIELLEDLCSQMKLGDFKLPSLKEDLKQKGGEE